VLKLGATSESAQIQDIVQKMMSELRLFPEEESVGGLVWPLTVVGCLALPHQQQFFENFVSQRSSGAEITFGNRSTALKILRTSWLMRQIEPRKSCDWWETSVSLGVSVLLI
jgi:hypothetical protein